MPGPDEIRRYQEENPVSPEFKAMVEELAARLPEVKYDPVIMRRRLQDEFTQFARRSCPPPPGPVPTPESTP